MKNLFATLRWLFSGLIPAPLVRLLDRDPRKFSGSIRYLNESGVDVFWVWVDGFPALAGMGDDIGPGRFGINGDANLVLGRMLYPACCTIRWRVVEDEEELFQHLALHSIATHERVGMFVFRFSKEQKWTFGFEPAPDYMK